jgi:hypothetical protein
MIAFGGVSLDEAFRAIDWDTIALLLGMMIIVAHLKVSGAFRALGALAVEHADAPLALLFATTTRAGALSAFLVNDAICLVMAPIVVGAGVEAVHSAARRRAPRLAGRRDALDARRQSLPHRLGRQSHCRRAGERGGVANQLFADFKVGCR